MPIHCNQQQIISVTRNVHTTLMRPILVNGYAPKGMIVRTRHQIHTTSQISLLLVGSACQTHLSVIHIHKIICVAHNAAHRMLILQLETCVPQPVYIMQL